MVPQCTTIPLATPAPAMAPIKAWEEEEGRPKAQVMMFQAMAPSRPHSTISSPCDLSVGVTARAKVSTSMIPLPIVFATSVPNRDPTRFIAAAISKAVFGFQARVDIAVAMALAAS